MYFSILKTGADSDIIKVDYAKNKTGGKNEKKDF